ncbi:hypothetical protein DFH08DRAFT_881208 [Mycena albidolilacea]|uniref:Uncharacterized protein n=1 Tax=Mycena albidolilacea TaxID=1033008 RepID=A0AAD7ELK2_9AGAR|nr:hypothetical protein DFH08DRAFT_881208 [Mycena albidolilacea]
MQPFFLLLAAALGTRAAVASHAPLEINTPVPGAAQCEPLLITWSGGIPPYAVAYARVLREIPHANNARSPAFKPTPSSRRPSLTSGWLPAAFSPGSSMLPLGNHPSSRSLMTRLTVYIPYKRTVQRHRRRRRWVHRWKLSRVGSS